MTQPGLKSFFNRGEKGFTIIELLVVLVISMTLFPAVPVFSQIVSVTSASNNHVAATRQVQNAGQWVVLDGQQAQTAAWNPGSNTLTLVLKNDPYNSTYSVVYSVNGTELTRKVGSGPEVVIAQGIADEENDFRVEEVDVEDGHLYKVTIKSTIGTYQQRSAELIYYFQPRIG